VPYRAKAAAQLQSGTADQAVATLGAGAEKTGAVEIYGDLAAAYERQGKMDQAIATYEEALKRHPRALPVANNLAMLLVSHRKDKASLDRASQVAQLLAGNDQASMLDTLGWVKYRNGAVGEALPLLRKAAEKAPTSAEIHYHLGMAQLQSGDRAAAKLSLESALSGTPKFHGTEDAKSALAGLRGAG
jgi:Flp pilus assembly protein TadD